MTIYYPLTKKEKEHLPLNYHYFENINVKKGKSELLKAVPKENNFMTGQKLSAVFYKPISKCL